MGLQTLVHLICMFIKIHGCIFVYRTDSDAEMQLICKLSKEAGAFDAVPCTHWADGGAGAVELGKAVQKAAEEPSNFSFLYDTQVISFLPEAF